MKENVIAYIKDYVERDTPIPAGEDVLSFNFLGSGYVDSIELFAFWVSIEEKFGVEITEEDMDRPELATIGGLADFVCMRMQTEEGA